jgi:hypothetical protein
VPRSSRIEFTADVTVTRGAGLDDRTPATGRRATAFVTLERAATDTGWRLVTFSLGPAL